MNDDLVVTPDEVRVVARVPGRDLLLLAALAAALLAVCALAVRVPPRPPDPFDPATCSADDPSDACLARLPPELRAVPARWQYFRWRASDLASWLGRSVPPDAMTPPPLGPGEVRLRLAHDADAPIRTALALHDPWIRDAELAGSPDPDWLDGHVALGDWLVRLGAERDWSAEPPDLPPPDPTGDAASYLAGVWRGMVHEEAVGALHEALEILGRERRDRFERAWSQAAVASDLQAADAARQAAHDATLGWLAAILGAVAAVLASTWTALGPRSVGVGVHHLRIGRQAIPWTAIVRVDWGGQSIEVWGRHGSRSLGPRILGPSARSALAKATDRALDRARSLPPPDPDALRQLDALRRS